MNHIKAKNIQIQIFVSLFRLLLDTREYLKRNSFCILLLGLNLFGVYPLGNKAYTLEFFEITLTI